MPWKEARYHLRLNTKASVLSTTTIKSFLRKISILRVEFYSTDETGMQIARGTGDFVNVAEREYFQEAIKGNEYISNIIVSKTTGDRMITFAAPIKFNDKIIGIVHRNYNLSHLHELLAAQAENAFVVDRTGMVAAHSQYEIAEGVHDEVDVSTSEFYTSGLASGY